MSSKESKHKDKSKHKSKDKKDKKRKHEEITERDEEKDLEMIEPPPKKQKKNETPKKPLVVDDSDEDVVEIVEEKEKKPKDTSKKKKKESKKSEKQVEEDESLEEDEGKGADFDGFKRNADGVVEGKYQKKEDELLWAAIKAAIASRGMGLEAGLDKLQKGAPRGMWDEIGTYLLFLYVLVLLIPVLI